MKTLSITLLSMAFVVSPSARAQVAGLDSPNPIQPYLNGVMPLTTPGTATGWSTENAFPNITFIDPLWLTEIPGTNEFLVVGKNGQLWRFPNNPAVTQGQVSPVLDWASKTQSSEDQGFYSLVFHPEFGDPASPNKDYAYVCYNHKPALTGADANHSYWRVSRFTWQPATGTLDPSSELVLINQFDRGRWHNGGAMFFDNDGFLNITDGDGGDSTEGGGLTGADGSLSRTQTLTKGLFSGVFRIDVNNDPAKSHAIRRQPTSPVNTLATASAWPASSTQGYGIPNDNPWQDPAGGLLEEYVVLGLRSPHTAHYDTLAGEIWLGDVGEGSREEMSRLVVGDNAQWGYREGSIGGPGSAATPPIGTDAPPAIDYPRSVGSCIIGGMRYRGAKWSALLAGKVLFGDHVRGSIWSANVDTPGATPEMQLLVEGFPTGNKVGLANFCTGANGEVYLMCVNGTNQPGGTIRRLVVAAVSGEPPQLLSQTGVFTDLANLTPAPGLIPYEVINPLWSDGAEKSRWIAVPNDGTHDSAAEKITFSEEDPWVFPPGTVLVKHFEIRTDERDPSQVKRLETRLLVCTADGGKYGVTYKWNETDTDAEILTTGLSEDYTVTATNGSSSLRNWDYPSRSDCMLCHTDNAGQALGVRTAPLLGNHFYQATGRSANQLATFNALGMFDRTLTAEEIDNLTPARALDDATAPLEHRIRSYLDTNCAHCHQPGGTVDYFDARLGTPLSRQGLVNAPIQGHFVLENGLYLKPGAPDLSALHVRLMNVGNGAAMPPLAKNEPDLNAINLLTSYINGLDDTQFQLEPSPTARYVRITALSEVNGNPWTSVAEFTVLDDVGNPIPHGEVTVSDFDSEETTAEFSPATQASDGDISTFWHTTWSGTADPLPHHLTLDLGSECAVGGYLYTPRQANQNGRIKNYQIDVSSDGFNWTSMDTGIWPNDDVPKSWSGWLAQRKARCEIAGPSGTVGGNFDVTVVFDHDVADFTAADIQVTGGSVTALRGTGYYYIATIAPAASPVTVEIPENAAHNEGPGSFASNPLSVNFADTLGPVASFTDLPPGGTVSGPFTLGIEFTEPPVGFSSANLTAIHATLSGLTGSGTRYDVVVTPTIEGSFSVTLSPPGITDEAGNPMPSPLSRTFQYSTEVLGVEAESGTLAGDMVLVNDPSASGGAYIWLPDGAYPNNFNTVNTTHSATYTFVLPRAGDWMLEGLVRSDDNSSDSFWVTIDSGTTYLWDTNQDSVGSMNFSWDLLNNRTPATDPVVLPLATGPHSVVVYGRDDGTRLDSLRFTSLRPLVKLSGPLVVTRPANLDVAVTFSEPVTGLDAADFLVSGGTAISLDGSGAAYTLHVEPTANETIISLTEQAAVDSTGAGNHYSDPLAVIVRSAFDEWASNFGLTGIQTLDDPNHNGIPALLEYLLHLDPLSAAAPVFDPTTGPFGLPVAQSIPAAGGRRLIIEFPRSSSAVAAGYRYIGQFTSDLATWQDVESATSSPMADGWEHVTLEDPQVLPANVPRFGRLKVLSP